MAFNKGKENKRRSVQDKKNKSRFDSKSITRIVLSVFIGLIAWVGLISYESYKLTDKNVTSVVVASADVKEGTLIDASNVKDYFKMQDVNSGLVSDKTIKDLNQVTGKATVNISKGEIVTSQRFYDVANQRDKFEDPVIVTYTVSGSEFASGGCIREGDIIDVLEIVTENGIKSSQVLVKDAYVLTARDSSGNIITGKDATSATISFDIYVERADEAYYNPKTHEEICVTKVVQP